MDKVYVIGFMGTGKTAIGRKLSERYDVDELDERFVQEYGQSIADFFAAHGEAGFRARESELLRNSQSQIVITGGGIIERPENRTWMKETGTVIWIDTPFDSIWRRIESDRNRPLVGKYETVKSLYMRRRPIYADGADLRLEGTKSIRELTAEIESVLEEKS